MQLWYNASMKIKAIYGFLTFLAILSVAASALAEDKKKQEAEPLNCRKMERAIRDDIYAANSCWEDEDCMHEYYGCPWQLAACHFSLTAKENAKERLAIRTKIKQYDKDCLSKDTERQAACKKQDEITRSTACERQKLLCVNGRCVTQTHILLQEGAAVGDAVDVYGSLQNFELEELDKKAAATPAAPEKDEAVKEKKSQ
jgi:hypothetical protein